MVDGMPLHSTADLIISADTIVVLNGKILEKPKDKDEATAMISSLSGNTRDGKWCCLLMFIIAGWTITVACWFVDVVGSGIIIFWSCIMYQYIVVKIMLCVDMCVDMCVDVDVAVYTAVSLSKPDTASQLGYSVRTFRCRDAFRYEEGHEVVYWSATWSTAVGKAGKRLWC